MNQWKTPQKLEKRVILFYFFLFIKKEFECKLLTLTGWQRMVLQILFFGPSNLLDPEESFNQISGKLIVSPVIKTLVYNKVPEAVSQS